MSGALSSNFRTGKQSGSIAELILADLFADIGSSYSDDTTSAIYAELLQYAKAIELIYRANNKLGNLYKARSLTPEIIDRWVKMLSILLPYNASNEQKKAAIQARLVMNGLSANYSGLHDLLTILAPNTYQNIIHTTWKQAHDHCNLEGGVDISGGQYIPSTSQGFSSATHYVAIELEQPSSMSNQAFYNEAYLTKATLNDFLPAWINHDWTIADDGFVLDADRNLDNSRLALAQKFEITAPGDTHTASEYLLLSQTSITRTGCPCIYFHLSISVPVNLRITTSSTFDNYLILSRGNDFDATPICSADDSTGSTNAEIVYDYLEAGDYLIEFSNVIPEVPADNSFTINILTT